VNSTLIRNVTNVVGVYRSWNGEEDVEIVELLLGFNMMMYHQSYTHKLVHGKTFIVSVFLLNGIGEKVDTILKY